MTDKTDFDNNNEYKIFVGNVSFDCKKIDFVNCFNNYYGFVSAELIHDEKTFKTRGFGFVIVSNKETFELILSSNIKLNNRELRLTEYKNIDNDNEISNKTIYKVFIKTDNILIKKNDIYLLLKDYGEIYNLEINFNTCVISYLDKKSFREVLNKKNIIYNNTKFYIYPYKKKLSYISSFKEYNIDSQQNDIYRAGFNHGSDAGYRKGYNLGYKKALEEVFNKKL
tara:strand:- start:1880 stop:2554 length:675 start_codon:yes stop_codon:yes gene_type:complete